MTENKNTGSEGTLKTTSDRIASAFDLAQDLDTLIPERRQARDILADPRDGALAGLFPCKASTSMDLFNADDCCEC